MYGLKRFRSIHENLAVIVGCQRTGTTLTGHVLGAHPRVFFIDETEHADLWLASRMRDPQGVRLSVFGEAAGLASEKYRPPGPLRSNGRLRPEVSHLVLKGINETYLQRELCQRLPQTRYVFTVRDVRDVVCSLAHLTVPFVKNQLRFMEEVPDLRERFADEIAQIGDDSSPLHVKHALVWRVKTSLLFDFQEAGVPLFVSRYEEFLASPRRHIGQLLRFVGVPMNRACLHHERVYHPYVVGRIAPVRPIDKTATSRWRSELTVAQEADVWSVAGSLMEQLEYTRIPLRESSPAVNVSHNAKATWR